ncbi:hypothetical protein ACHQM5_012846 [Ranunculus cassubicifolius]
MAKEEFDIMKLPSYVWEHLLLPRLDHKEYIRFGAVCKPWNHIAVKNQNPLPWLMLSFNQYTSTGLFFSLFEAQTYSLKVPQVVSESYCTGSTHGDLIMAHQKQGNFVYNPFSKWSLSLPKQHIPPVDMEEAEPEYVAFYFKKSISLNPRSCEFVIASLCSNPRLIEISTPNHNEWSLYGTGNFYEKPVYDDFDNDLFKSNNDAVGLYVIKYGEEEEEGLLMIFRVRDEIDTFEVYKFVTIRFYVYRLDRSADVAKWVQVKSLGDQMIFLGKNSAISISAKDIPGFKGNCIYFTDDAPVTFYRGWSSRRPYSDNGVFYLEDGRVDSFFPINFSHPFNAQPAQPVWVIPNKIPAMGVEAFSLN